MRHVYQAAIVLSLTGIFALLSPAQVTPAKLTVNNYQLLSEQRLSRTQSQYTYRADLVNIGAAQPALTATVVSASPAITVLSGMGNLHFPPVPASGRVTSTNTFVVLVDRSGDTNFANLFWSFFAPVANAGASQTVPIGSTATLNGSGTTNPTGIGTLTYSWVFSSRPPGTRAVLQNATAVMPTFVPDVKGDFVITLTVDNGAGTDTASTTVSTVSSRPVADAGPDQSVKTGANVILSGAKSHDVDGNPLTYAWTLIASPSRSNAVLSGPSTVSPSFIADADGTYIAQLIVSDVNGNSDPDTVSITTQNSAPVANAGPNQVVTRGATVQLNGAGSTDVDGDPLTYRWTLTTLPAGSHAILNNPTVPNPTFATDADGTYIAQLIVNDGHLDSPPSTVNITTNAIQPPVANAGLDQSLAHGSLVTLTGGGTDPQSLPLTFKWSLTSRPTGSTAVLSNPGAQNPSFIADLPGTYIAQLIVSNGTLNSPPSTITISSTNTAPVANPGPNRFVTIGGTVTLDGSSSSDAENDPLTYAWAMLSVPAGSSASLLSPTIVSPTFIADVAGQYVVQLIVRDAYTVSSAVTTTVTAGSSGGLTVDPNPLNLPNAPGDLVVTIPFPAGAGGQIVKLAALDPGIVSVPSTVTVLQNATKVNAHITPVALGSTLVIASLQGLQPATVTVNVTLPTIAVSLSANVVGISRSVTGTITLSGPAQASGIDVSLLADQNGIVSTPLTVHVNGGAGTAIFTLTGVTAGQVNITASFPGYISGSAAVTVAHTGALAVQANASVGIGQTANLKISLVSPAPVGGVTVALVSSDTNKLNVSPTVFFSQGNTTPDVSAQITGVGFGTAIVSAAAAGFTGDSQPVQVVLSLNFTPKLVTMNPGGSQTISLGIPGGAPAGGLLVTLTSDNSAFATVPPTVTIPGGSLSVPVPVTGVGVGLATVTASSALLGVLSGTATVNVIQGVSITTASLPAGTVGTNYSATVSASGGTGPYTFSATNLPAGLTMSNGGTISGSPTAAGTATVAITATDSSAPTHLTATANLSLTINAALAISTSSLPGGTAGSAYTASVAATGGVGPYTFAATNLPAGLTMNSAGAISGTPAAAVTSTANVTVTDSQTPTHATASAALTIVISPALAVSTTSLPAAVVGIAYSASLAATGGASPYSFAVTGLPAGLTANPAGQITGTPTASGVSTVNVTVQDSTSPTHLTANATLSVTVNPPALVITTASLPNGAIGIQYDFSVTAVGGTVPYTFSATGLPAGLTISAAGHISGIPTNIGPVTAAITVTDTTNPTHLSTTANLAITINPPTLAVATTSLVSGTVGVSYSAPVSATGGTPGYAFTATGLPAGLTMAANGQISGIPTTAGSSSVAITVTDQATPTHGSATAQLTLVIAPPPLTITSTSLPSGIAGTAYNTTVSAGGGTPAYTFSAAGLPAGLSISAAGAISGTPSVAGTSTVVVTVTDLSSPSHMTATASLPLTIAPPALVITTATLPAGTVGTVYGAAVAATGGTPGYTFTASGLPAGLSISAAGAIGGTPSAAGTSNAVITVTDSASPTHVTATATLAVTIAPAPLVITTASLPAGTVGTAYSAAVAATGGTPAYTFTASGLPAGLSITAAGAISGTPGGPGTSSVLITVTDSASPTHVTATATLAVTIAPPALAITTATLPAGTVGIAYGATITATGGTPAYTFTATGLPAGLSISPAGNISGTPLAAGTGNAIITVTDSASPTHVTATATIAVTIAPAALVITTASLPSGIVGTPYNASVNASGGTPGYTFTATGLPAGLNISPAGVISGTPSAAGTTSASVTVTDSANPTHVTATATIPIIIAPPPPAITTTSLPTGTVGVFYSATVNGTGGTTPYVFTATGLPTGLSITSGGLISGQPAVAGTSSVVITLTDAAVPSHKTATATLSLVISPKPLQITNGFLVDGVQFTPYSAGLGATGGTVPYIWSLVSGTLPNGLSLNPATGIVSGTPSVAAFSTPLVFHVVDSGNPVQFAEASVTLSIAPSSGLPSLAVSSATVGQSLQTEVTVTLSQAPFSAVVVTVSSSNPSTIGIAGRPGDVGTGTLSVPLAAGTTSFSVFVQGLQSSGSAIVTASAANYVSGSSTVTARPSGFVLAGPNGIGASFATNQGTSTTLTVSAAQLDAAGGFVQIQQVKGGSSVPVTLTSSALNIGTVAPLSLTFVGGTDSQTVQFTANSSTPGSTIVTANVPSGFSAPAGNANVLPVTVQIAQIIPASATVGQNLQTNANITLQGVAPADLLVTIVSNNPAKLLLSTNPASAGATSITMTIRAGHNATPDFYVYGLGNSGTATYNASAAGFGNANGTVTLSPSGFVISGPFGLGQNFFTTTGSLPSSVDILAAMLDSSGNYVGTQPVAGGLTVGVNLTTSPNSIGTITSPASFTGGAISATAQFQPLANGTTTLKALAPAGFSSAQYGTVTVTVITPKITIDTGNTIGRGLQQQGTIFLGAAAPSGGVLVTLTSSNAGALNFSATSAAAGTAALTITIPAGAFSAPYYMQALVDTGSVTVTATAPNYTSGSGTEAFAPSGVIIGGIFGPGFPVQTPVGSKIPLTVSTAILDSLGNVVQTQSLAGGSTLNLQLTNSDSTVGTVPLTAAIVGGTSDGVNQFTALKVGQTVVRVVQPSGFSLPNQLATSQTINVQ